MDGDGRFRKKTRLTHYDVIDKKPYDCLSSFVVEIQFSDDCGIIKPYRMRKRSESGETHS